MNHTGNVYGSFPSLWVLELRNCDHNACNDRRRKKPVVIGYVFEALVLFIQFKLLCLVSQDVVLKHLLKSLFLTMHIFLKLIIFGKQKVEVVFHDKNYCWALLAFCSP